MKAFKMQHIKRCASVKQTLWWCKVGTGHFMDSDHLTSETY